MKWLLFQPMQSYECVTAGMWEMGRLAEMEHCLMSRVETDLAGGFADRSLVIEVDDCFPIDRGGVKCSAPNPLWIFRKAGQATSSLHLPRILCYHGEIWTYVIRNIGCWSNNLTIMLPHPSLEVKPNKMEKMTSSRIVFFNYKYCCVLVWYEVGQCWIYLTLFPFPHLHVPFLLKESKDVNWENSTSNPPQNKMFPRQITNYVRFQRIVIE